MKQVDIVIIGAGPIGLSAAIGFLQKGLSVVVVEKNARKTPVEDGRGYALSYGTTSFLNQIRVWSDLKSKASPIKSIEVAEKGSSQKLHFDSSDYPQEAMGYLVESHLLNASLQKAASEVEIIYEEEVVEAETSLGYQKLSLKNGDVIKARLLIAADGKKSSMRDKMGISFKTQNYPHPAFVTRISHEFPHENRAYEIFLEKGLLALLPLNGNKSSVVWCMEEQDAQDMVAAEAGKVEKAIYSMFPALGQITLAGNRFTYPLKAVLSDQLAAARFVLLGDSAQSIHPVAGQGLNLGFRGLHTLYCHIAKAFDLGLDIGSDQILNFYEKEHLKERQKFYHLTDALIHLYDTPVVPLKPLRRVGLGLVNRIAPLKRAMIKQAMGVSNLEAASYLRDRYNRVG